MSLMLKVCGMRDPDNIRELLLLKPDFIGFIFYEKSSRYINETLDAEVLSLLNNIKKTGVFVNEITEVILEKVTDFSLDYVQLHGDETPEFCKEISKKVNVIKAFRILPDFDFSKLKAYAPYCKYFLFDADTSQYGGSGKKFDWELLNRYKESIPLFLSGGIGPEDIELIKKIKSEKYHIEVIDINSKFETAPAFKDIQKIKKFKNELSR